MVDLNSQIKDKINDINSFELTAQNTTDADVKAVNEARAKDALKETEVLKDQKTQLDQTGQYSTSGYYGLTDNAGQPPGGTGQGMLFPQEEPPRGSIPLANAGSATEQNDLAQEEEKDLETTDTDAYAANNLKGEAISGENRFSGFDLSGENSLKKLNRQRGQLDSVDGKPMYQIPWDWRFGVAYTSSQSIENSMPAGPEWVGSPSIMNDLALIRFHHVAGNRHHVHLLDNENNQLFRSAGLTRKVATSENNKAKKSLQQDTTTNKEGDVRISESEYSGLGIDSNDPAYGKLEGVYKRTDGTLYADYISTTSRLWTPTKSGEGLESTPKDLIVPIGEDPNTEKYWEKNLGYKKCPDPNSQGADVWVDESEGCDKWLEQLNAVKGPGADNKKSRDEMLAEAARKKKAIEAQINRQWTDANGDVYTRLPIMSNETEVLGDVALEPTTDNLCNNSNWLDKPQFQYKYSDFLYCKFWNKVPNNRLVTLRRYPSPIIDSGAVFGQDLDGKYVKPVAQAVTWLDEAAGNTIESIMSMNWKINWRELNSQINEVQGNEQGADQGPFPNLGKWLGMMDAVTSGGGSYGRISGWDQERAKFDPYKDGMYANRIYGPVNVIAKTKARERGLDFENTITLKFTYLLKSIGGVNPKAAMLDILANMLALTYNNAGFWGGANRYFPNKPAYPFPGGKKGFESWYSGDFEGFFDSMGAQLNQTIGSLGNMLSDLISNPGKALGTLFSGGGKLWMAEKQRDKRPGILTFKALLTGDPVGEWHLVVGNPFNPDLMIGNLICTGTKVSFSEGFGVDDFPEEMTFEITLEHGRPRDKGDIESMFNRGGGRLHYAPYGVKEMAWNTASSTRDSKVDTSWKKGSTTKQGQLNTSGGQSIDMNGGGSFAGGMLNSYEQGAGGNLLSSSFKTAGKSWDVTVQQAFKLAQQVGQSRGPSISTTK